MYVNIYITVLLVSWWNGKKIRKVFETVNLILIGSDKLLSKYLIIAHKSFLYNTFVYIFDRPFTSNWMQYSGFIIMTTTCTPTDTLSKMQAKYCMKMVFQRRLKTIGQAKWYLCTYSMLLKIRN